jgi:hypothetical protein
MVSSRIWCSWPNIYYSLTVTVLFLWGACSDERTGLSFVYAAGPQRSLSLRFETSLFVASYDSQGPGGGIGPRLHTGVKRPLLFPVSLRRGQCRKHNSTAGDTENTSHVIAKHCWGVTSLRMRKLHGSVFTELETGFITLLFYCCVRVLVRNGCFFGSTALACSKYATIFIFTI